MKLLCFLQDEASMPLGPLNFLTMIQIFQLAFSGFWHFVGFAILFGAFLDCLLKIISRLIRASIVRKIGWPPQHLDADGDFYQSERD